MKTKEELSLSANFVQQNVWRNNSHPPLGSPPPFTTATTTTTHHSRRMHCSWRVYEDIPVNGRRGGRGEPVYPSIATVELQVVTVGVDGGSCRLDLRPPPEEGRSGYWRQDAAQR